MVETKPNKLHEHISNSPLVKAAIIEAVHRFYYDRVLSERKQDKQDLLDTKAADVLDTAWNLLPDWRYILLTQPKRYTAEERTNSVSIYGKPAEIIPLEITIRIE